jgi:hypothetical protein
MGTDVNLRNQSAGLSHFTCLPGLENIWRACSKRLMDSLAGDLPPRLPQTEYS